MRGVDAPKFLQGIVTNNIGPESNSGFFAAFLTAQGKVLHDVFVYPTAGSLWHEQQGRNETAEEPGYLVEVDKEQADSLLKHLKRHKLRSKFVLRRLEDGELDVWSIWREGERWTAHGQSQSLSSDGKVIGLTDYRAPGMGQRLLLPSSGVESYLGNVEQAPLSAYTIRRYLRGVPEGQKEMPRDDCLPMNSNLDFMGGIDFKKGCYVGQELTIRTHHTGVVRRRILPVALYERDYDPPNDLEYDASSTIDGSEFDSIDIRRDDKRKRSTGKFVAGIGNIGLGMCRLEQMSDLTISGEGNSYTPGDRFSVESPNGEAIGLRAFVPDWIRGNIKEPKIQKRVE